MTTAHRATWNSIKGKADPGGVRTVPSTFVSSKDSYCKQELKVRKDNFFSKERNEVKKDLNSKESFIIKLMNKKLEDKVSQNKNTILSLKEKLENEISSNTSSNSDDSDSDEKTCLKPLIDVKNLDNLEENSNKDLSDDSDSDDEELLREYEKIQQAKKEQERRKEIEESNKVKDRTEEEILSGNPIYAQDYFLKKRWYEDTVFKNQARTNKVDNQFINDTIRSDFFKKFIDKSIK